MAVDSDVDERHVEHTRATVRPDKAAAVADLAESFRGSSAAVLTEYRGLTVKQIGALRTALGAETTYAVVKNTLTRIAAADAGVTGVDDLLQGPTAVAFIRGEPVAAAKALREFARANPVLVVKGGVMDGRALSAQEVGRLADLESREVLLAKMAGALLASLSNAASLFNAPLAQAARVLGALQAKAEDDPSVLSAAPAPAATTAEDAPPPADAPAPAPDVPVTAEVEVASASDSALPAEDVLVGDLPSPDMASAPLPPADPVDGAAELTEAAPEQ